MRDKIETYMAVTLAAAVVISPTYITIQIIGYFIKLISLL
jgi:hypothetical protein